MAENDNEILQAVPVGKDNAETIYAIAKKTSYKWAVVKSKLLELKINNKVEFEREETKNGTKWQFWKKGSNLAKISSLKEATIKVVEEINDKYETDLVVKSYDVNQARHKLVRTLEGKGFWVVFKRKPFMSFGKIFDIEYDGAGESLNKDVVIEGDEKDVNKFLFVYSNGKIYSISPLKFKRYAQEEETIRETSSGETTYSVPMDLLERWN